MTKIVPLNAHQYASSEPRPMAIGVRGISRDGVEVVFNKPAVLVDGGQASPIWNVSWFDLGEALLARAERIGKKP